MCKKITLCMVAAFLFASCDSDPYSGFGAICTEAHPAVTHARSMPQEQLAFLYAEIYSLREKNTESRIEYSKWREPIPEKLRFLDAVRIRPNYYPQPNIMLAGCMDEYVVLSFHDDEHGGPMIELTWADPSAECPYCIGREVLWPASVSSHLNQ